MKRFLLLSIATPRKKLIVTGKNYPLSLKQSNVAGSKINIETVCAQGLEIEVLDGLESLLDKSLIGQEEDFEGQPRFVMLESLHAYARERHKEYEDWEATRIAHAEWVLAFAEAGEGGIFGQTPNVWVNRLKAEESNIRVVLERCQSGQLVPEIGVRLAGALRYYWESTGKLSEGMALIESMLSLSSELPKAVRAKALCGVGVLSYWRGDWQMHKGCSKTMTWQPKILRRRSGNREKNLVISSCPCCSATMAMCSTGRGNTSLPKIFFSRASGRARP